MNGEHSLKNKGIYILTGAVGSGKTTFIFNWLKDHPFSGGIITLTRQNCRVLYDVIGKEEINFETPPDEKAETVNIGRYKFYKSAFERAEEIIENTDFVKTGCFVLDEAGPLELRGEGFDKAVRKLIEINREYGTALVFIVRENCVNDFINKYALIGPLVRTKENFSL